MFCWAIATEPWQLFPAALISGAGWAFTSGAAINAMVAPWFDRRRPAAISMAFNGASIGGLVFAPLWALLIAEFGFVAAAAAIGGAMVVTLWWLAGRFLRPTPAGMGLAPDGGLPAVLAGLWAINGPLDSALRSRTVRQCGATRRFATLSVAFALGLFAQIGLFTHLFSFLASALGEAGAGAAISFVTACAIAGRMLLGGILPARTNRRVAAAVNFAVQIAGTLALLAAGGTSVPLLLIGCGLFGLGVGNLVSLPPLVAQAEFARADVGRVVALVTAVNQAVFAFAPAIFGALHDLTGGSSAAIAAAGIVQIVAAMVVLAGSRRRTYGADARC